VSAGFRRHLDVGIFLIVWAFAVAPGVWSTRDLDWPYDADGFRDLAVAQHIREGRWLSDPFYVGEAAWYNPLVPAVIAVLSEPLGLDTSVGSARLGAWVNALAPLAFWLCARRLLGVWPALCAVCGFLFLPGRPQPWASATYSPWIFPSIAAQAPLYVGLFVVMKGESSLARSALSGVLLALTFLAHTAAGVLLGALTLAVSVRRTPDTSRSLSSRALRVVMPFSIAALITAPFLLPLATRYRFHVLNRVPGTWSDDGLRFSTLFFDLGRPGSFLLLALMVLGAISIWRARDSSVKIVLVAWGLVATVGHWYASLAAASATLPSIVPAFHFFFLMRAWTWLLFGSGVAALLDMAARRLAAARSRSIDAPIVGALAAALFVVSVYPRYLGREAFTRAPAVSRELAQADGRVMSDWIRSHIPASAVVAADDEDALRIVGPAGRFVVSVSPAFSNPYVDHAARAAARDHVVAALVAGDKESFAGVTSRLGVTHLLVRTEMAARIRLANPTLEELFSSGTLVLFRLVYRSG
jgi:hypothetical protein